MQRDFMIRRICELPNKIARRYDLDPRRLLLLISGAVEIPKIRLVVGSSAFMAIFLNFQ